MWCLFATVWTLPQAIVSAIRHALTRRYVGKILCNIKLPSKELDRETWHVIGDVRSGRRLGLDITIVDGHIVCMVSSGIDIDEPWVLQKFCVALLKDNCRYQVGANRLLPCPLGLKLIHSHNFDPKRYKPKEVALMCRLLIRQMHEVIEQLREAELIIPVDPPVR